MRSDSKEYIRKLLGSLDPLEPIPTGVQPVFHRDEKIRAVIFDIYGTLLISSSGDVDQADISEGNLGLALEAAGIKLTGAVENPLDHILKDFEYTIRVCHESAKHNQVPYPEIDILSIWKIVLMHARRKKLIEFSEDADILLTTCVFEFLSNKVYPMPGMQDTLHELQKKEIPLGIVSNAQFYTPVLMNFFFNEKVSLKEKIKGFDRELTVFSYKFGRGKPDVTLFRELVPVLKWKYGLIPEEVLFVGNDMLKDIWTAAAVGFKTALFAGDKRSLRMRSDDERTATLKPDYIIDSLEQILNIVV